MKNYIVINGVRHDLQSKKGTSCNECSLREYCAADTSICAVYANYNWEKISNYYFVKHQKS